MDQIPVTQAPSLFQVTPIGSCRITGPLRMGQDRWRYALNRTGVYGYCHSANEAVQMALRLTGQLKIPDRIWPFLSESEPNEETHVASDAYVVEISSAKSVMLDDWPIQLNYLSRRFPQVFSDQGLARAFWTIVDTGKAAHIRAFLEQRGVRSADADLLAKVRRRWTTEEDLLDAMSMLQDILPEVLFVTHVNARQPNGAEIPIRVKLIGMLHRAAKKLDARIYDPTDAMTFIGQDHALADNTDGLAHFSERFEELVSLELQSRLRPTAANFPFPRSVPQSPVESLFQAAELRKAEPRTAAMIVGDLIGIDPSLAAPAAVSLAGNGHLEDCDQIELISQFLSTREQFKLWAQGKLRLPDDVGDLSDADFADAVLRFDEPDWLGKTAVLLNLAVDRIGQATHDALAKCLDDLVDRPIDLAMRCQTILTHLPNHRSAIHHMGTLRGWLREKASEDLTDQTAILLDAVNQNISGPLSSVDLRLSRHFFSAGQDDLAIATGLRALEHGSDNLTLRIMLMRAARRSGDNRLADLAHSVVERAEGNDKYISEARAALTSTKEFA